ncbi:uncharacterized protein BDW47DRAFT_72919 [Aspergillus candidus]|uniref:Uncharacterized protein n=1 Tax=Aspergillus candidus TaxID=41067 RepID=A0A2I2F203_ASPCN|nr:hypothetical protein BDW47DRAFT_72919 [Aspergillus candidus]PLB34647.1 hypothetical protein BDW47DRAFT_72919 [Aspergillus candidus]
MASPAEKYARESGLCIGGNCAVGGSPQPCVEGSCEGHDGSSCRKSDIVICPGGN